MGEAVGWRSRVTTRAKARRAPTAAARNARATPTIAFVPAGRRQQRRRPIRTVLLRVVVVHVKHEYLVSGAEALSQSSSYATPDPQTRRCTPPPPPPPAPLHSLAPNRNSFCDGMDAISRHPDMPPWTSFGDR